MGGTIALLVNTVPSVFWALMHLYHHPGFLQEVRDEVDACIHTSTDPGDSANTTLNIIDVVSLKEKCPLLLSAYQEVLRYRTIGASVREVMEDTYLGPYLLKKGAMLQMPSRVIQTDETLWGNTDFTPAGFSQKKRKTGPATCVSVPLVAVRRCVLGDTLLLMRFLPSSRCSSCGSM